MQIQISLLLKRSADPDLPCLQRQGLYGFSRTRVKLNLQFWFEKLAITCFHSEIREKCLYFFVEIKSASSVGMMKYIAI